MNLFHGYDMSLTSTGYCILDESSNIVKTGLIRTQPQDGPLSVRLRKIHRTITELLAEYPPTVSCIEGPSFISVHRSFDLYCCSGVALSLLPEPILMVPPSTLKKFFTGSGTASKEQMVEAAYEGCRGPDYADAYALSKMAFTYYYTEKATRNQLESLQKLRRT